MPDRVLFNPHDRGNLKDPGDVHDPRETNDPSVVDDRGGQGPAVLGMVGPSLISVAVTLLHPLAVLPSYSCEGDAGADLVTISSLTLEPGERAVLRTGLAIALPAGFAGFVHPRSGLAARAGLGLVNAPGTIDAGYRGEIMIIAINHDLHQPIEVVSGDRVAQLVIQRVQTAIFVEVDSLSESSRGTGGLGSTGGAAALPGTDTLEAEMDRAIRAPSPLRIEQSIQGDQR